MKNPITRITRTMTQSMRKVKTWHSFTELGKPMQNNELKLAFSLFDKNRDGFICLDELRHAMQALGVPVSEKHLRDMFKHVDIDGNGLIDYEEFVQLMKSRTERQSEDAEMRAYFAAFDKDRNGFIDGHELKTTLGDLGMAVTDADVREMMTEAGVQIKGRIYYEDFVRLMTGKIGNAHRQLSGRGPNNDNSRQQQQQQQRTEQHANEDEETRELRMAFAMFDKDGDGAITSSELLGVMTSLGYDTSTEKVQEMIHRVDLDGNGTIEFDELRRLMRKRHQLAMITRHDRRAEEEEMRQAFKVFDKDGSGFIDAADLRSTMSELGVPLSSSDVSAMMAEAGVKVDGRIYYEDFVRIMFGQILKPMHIKVGESTVSSEELQEMKVAFALFDIDGDGAITTSELRSVMRSLGYDTSDKVVSGMIDRFDYDGNGTLEFDEFLRAMTSRNHQGVTRWQRSSSKSREPDSWRAFKMFDRDRNGYISASELKQAMGELGVVLSDDDVQLMIKEADIDGDGRINYKEFVNMMEGNFHCDATPSSSGESSGSLLSLAMSVDPATLRTPATDDSDHTTYSPADRRNGETVDVTPRTSSVTSSSLGVQRVTRSQRGTTRQACSPLTRT